MKKAQRAKPFVCRGFVVHHDRCGLKVGTDTIYFAAYVGRTKWFTSQPRTALDVGTGTGLLSLILAHRLPSLEAVHGVELDDEAYAQTQENYELSPWRQKMKVFHSSFQQYSSQFSSVESTGEADGNGVPSSGYDLLICNPPYYPRPPNYPPGDMSPRAHARFSDFLSVEDLLTGVKQCLRKDNGQFWLMYPYSVADSISSEAGRHELHLKHRCDICFRKGKQLQRSILMFERSSAHPIGYQVDRQHVTLREEDSSYTKEFIEMTKDIYLEELTSDRNRMDIPHS